ncbi:MAG: TlpA disulfide reductase family protein [Armatimonadota bacterium]|nr:TlpA disulfide reductase family protein [Armatimonadota bacterium]
MRRWRWLLFLVVPLVLATGWVLRRAQVPTTPQVFSAPRPLPTGSPLGRPAPGFLRETLDRRELALSELLGKPVVLNFWASWCVPCRAEAPTLAQAARRFRGRVHFVGVNVADEIQEARRFAEQYGLPFPSVLDDDGSLLRAYRVVGLPTTVFVTASGVIRDGHAGPFLGAEGARRLEAYLLRLLKEP